jgi:hypothetical protein
MGGFQVMASAARQTIELCNAQAAQLSLHHMINDSALVALWGQGWDGSGDGNYWAAWSTHGFLTAELVPPPAGPIVVRCSTTGDQVMASPALQLHNLCTQHAVGNVAIDRNDTSRRIKALLPSCWGIGCPWHMAPADWLSWARGHPQG